MTGGSDTPRISDRPRGDSQNTILLSARAVSRRFGRHVALAATTLDVRAGEALALVGPNGAGKSTLLSILAGALAPTEGEIRAAHARRKVGWVPQRPAHYGRLSARENLELFARLAGVRAVADEVERLLALFGLADDGKPANRLSAGNQQRLNLALALVADPDVLLLDEPTASLDPDHRRRIWDLVADVKERGGAVVFATQNPDEVERLADRIVVLGSGAVVFAGPLDEYAQRAGAHAFA